MEKEKDNKKRIVLKITVIVLVLLVVLVLTYIGLFLYNYIRHMKVLDGDIIVYDPLSATALGIDPDKLKDTGKIEILLMGESNANQGTDKEAYYLADTIMVLSYNPQTQHAAILSIPRDTYVGKRNKGTADAQYLASFKINSLYRNREEIDSAIKAVNELTGLEIEHYVLIDTESIADIVDAIGNVWFDVPIDMDYDDESQDLHIHLKAGKQLIDGNKAEQLLRFRHNQDGTSYPVEYGDNDMGRMRTQREFIMEVAKQLLKVENAPKALDLLNILSKNVITNLEFQDLKYYIPYLFKFDTSNITTATVPGVSEQYDGIWIYSADKKETIEVVEGLFANKVVDDVDVSVDK